MRAILRVSIILILLFNGVMAFEYKDVKKFSLKKDEFKQILVKYMGYKRLFKFRWTLYTNEGLVIHRSYDKDVAQNILYLNNRNQSFKLFLKSKGADYYEVPYFLVKFKEFDFKKNEAIFEIFLSDKRNQLEIRYLKNDNKTKTEDM